LARLALALLLLLAAAFAAAQVPKDPERLASMGYVETRVLEAFFSGRGVPRQDRPERARSAVRAFGTKAPVELILDDAVFVPAARTITSRVIADLEGRTAEPAAAPASAERVRIAVVDREQVNKTLIPVHGDAVALRIDKAAKSVGEQFQIDIIIEGAYWVDPVLDITSQVLLMVEGKPVESARLSAIPQIAAKIGCMDSRRVLSDSRPAVAGKDRLEREFTQRDKALQELRDRAGAESEEFRRGVQQFNDDLRRRRSAELNAVVRASNNVIVHMARSERYDFVLQDAVHCAAKLDMTAAVIGRLDK